LSSLSSIISQENAGNKLPPGLRKAKGSILDLSAELTALVVSLYGQSSLSNGNLSGHFNR